MGKIIVNNIKNEGLNHLIFKYFWKLINDLWQKTIIVFLYFFEKLKILYIVYIEYIKILLCQFFYLSTIM